MSGKKHILAGRLIDGAGGEVRRGVCLVVENGTIESIVPAAQALPEKQQNIVDLSHCTIMPPLFDCYVKLSSSSAVDEKMRNGNTETDDSYAAAASLIEQNLHFNHSHGVLGIANHDDSSHVAKFIAEGRVNSEMSINNSAGLSVQSAKEVSPGKLWSPVFVSLEIGAAVRREQLQPEPGSEEEGLETAGHDPGINQVVLANGENHIKEAVDNGCIAVLQGYGMTEEILGVMAERGIVWIPNLVRMRNLMEDENRQLSNSASKFFKKQLAQLRLAKQYGVKVALGTGAGNPSVIHGESAVEEIRLLTKAGYSLVEAIQCSSSIGASVFGVDGFGPLQMGKPANFLVSRGLIAQLPRKLSYLEGIYIEAEPSRIYRKNPVKTVYKR